jgi:glycosyltransferase involved in cell wall biosynthesis
MKIAHITSYLVPGFGYEELPLARAQRRMGHDVTIIASNFLHPPGSFYGVLKARFPERRVTPCDENQDGVRVIRLGSLELPGRRVWMRGLAHEIRHLDPDVVHCHNLLQTQTVRIALGKAMGRPPRRLVVDDHMHQSVVRRTLAGRVFYTVYRSALQPLMAREIDSFCAISEDTRDYLRDMCGVRAQIEVRPLGVDVDVFKPSPALRLEWRRRLNLDANELVLLYTGKLIEAKGVHVLVAAALRLLNEGERLKVLAVGDAEPTYLERIRGQIAAAGRMEDFRFHPSVQHSELPGAYAAGDIAIWPRQESMGAFEAMSTALPVVVSNRSGYARLVTGGPGVTFEHDDDTALAGVLRDLFDPARRAALGAAGRTLTQRDYSWQRSAERYLETYGEAAASVTTRR